MISKTISTSERFSELAGPLAEFSQLLFVLLVAHADDKGRLEGAPFTVKHMVVPTSARTVQEVGESLRLLADIGLIQWYEVPPVDPNDRRVCKYIQINKFNDHQTLHGHQDRPSRFPDPPTSAQSRPKSPTSAQTRPNRIEVNRIEVNRIEEEQEHTHLQKSGPNSDQIRAKSGQPPENVRTVPLLGRGNRHQNHACCGRVCLHSTLFAEFEQLAGNQSDPDGYVRKFFATWDNRYAKGDRSAQTIGEDGFHFWRERWAETHPKAPKPGEKRAKLPTVDELRKQHSEKRA